MNPKLMAALRARKKHEASEAKAETKAETMPASGSPGTPSEAVGASGSLTDGHKRVRAHLEKGMKGDRRHAKLHLKLALHAHKAACGDCEDAA